MIVVPDFIWMPLATWLVTACWFKRRKLSEKLFGDDKYAEANK